VNAAWYSPPCGIRFDTKVYIEVCYDESINKVFIWIKNSYIIAMPKKRSEQMKNCTNCAKILVCVFKNRNSGKPLNEIVKICKLANIQAVVRLITANKLDKDFTDLSTN
jgi:hypothetical protein